MKIQKTYFKKVILLLLLLSGGLEFSYGISSVANFEEEQKISVSTEFNEQLQDLREGSLPGVLALNLYKTYYSSWLSPYQYLSSEETLRSTSYIQFSRQIEPALDSTGMIFPFHFFL